MTRHFLLSLLATAGLIACSGGDKAPADGDTATANPSDAVFECPPEKLLTNADYTDKGPAANEDFAAYHAENGKRKAVTTTPSGLQYAVAQKGLKNGARPFGGQIVTVHYHGYFPDGSVFDSSYDRNDTVNFPANGVIKGWVESLQSMKVCEARTLYIPGNLAYGPQGREGIPPNATLLFNVQLIAVKP